MTERNENKGSRERLVSAQDSKSIVLFSLIMVLGAALRVYDLGGESYWLDEVTMIDVAGRNLQSIFLQAQEGRPPVFVVLAHFWL